MATLFTLILLAAIGAAIFYGVKKKWKFFKFSLAAILISFVGVGVAAPSAQTKGTNPPVPVVSQPKIETKTVEVKSDVQFETTTQDDNNLAKGTTKVTQEGVNGQRTISYEVTYKDGVEQSRKETSNNITTQPVNKIVANGTYVAPAPTSQPTTSTGQRTGAVCMDGSTSTATGSGACSHHGGVQYWTY